MKILGLTVVSLVVASLFCLNNFAKHSNYFTHNGECFIDTSVNNLVLSKDLTPILGNLELQLKDCDPNCTLTYFNNDTTEKLVLYFYPGRIKNQCSYFKISKYSKKEKCTNPIILKDNKFVSGHRIEISDSYTKIVSLLRGYHIDVEEIDSVKIITYFLKLNKNCNHYMKRYNMPLYQSKYVFKNNQLVSFEFGFVYP